MKTYQKILGQQVVSSPFSCLEKFNRIDRYFTPSDICAVFGSVWLGLEIHIGMKVNPHCKTGVAWVDFDRFIETVTGKETLHDTLGITYQTITEEESTDVKFRNVKYVSSHFCQG